MILRFLVVIAIANIRTIASSSSSDVVNADDGTVLLSIGTMHHPAVIAISFQCSSAFVNSEENEVIVPCGVGDGASKDELLLVASAAEAFLHNSQLMQLGLEHNINDGIEVYEGMDVSATTLTSSVVGNLRGMNTVPADDDDDSHNAILLSTMFHFRMSSNNFSPSDPSSRPTESYISQLLHAAFVGEEAAFLVKLRETTNKVSAESWLKRVMGYKTQLVGSDMEVTAYGRHLQNANTDSGNSSSSNSNSSINNILLIVGAAGAAISLVLLCGGLCYAKRSFKVDDGGVGGNKKKSPAHASNGNVDVMFQPGKNNPRSSGSSRLFKKKSSSGKNSYQDGANADAPSSPPPPPPPPRATLNDYDDDDESNADFMLARAALNHSMESKSMMGGGGVSSIAGDESHAQTYGDDMSYAFTVDGESLAPMGGGHTNGISPGNTNIDGDAAIGAGGLESFANDKGIFRWNEEGTKMVYTPTLGKSESNEMNGFVFDKRKKKWVVKEQVIGEKSVSFQPNTNAARSGGLAQPISASRIRSGDSAGTGMTGLTGMTDFTYDDVALDWTKRPRSNISDVSNIVEGDESSYSPSVPQEQGVEVSADEALTPIPDDVSAFTGFTDYSPNESPVWVTPERVPSGISDEATTSTFATGEPGRIIRKAPLNKPNKMMIAEETPFDEDETPFDELTRSRYGSTRRSNNGIAMPNMLDDLDSQSESGMSTGSANSEQVLDDLDKLSKFMMERKRSSKSQKGGSFSKGSRVGSFGSTSRKFNKR